MMANGNDDRPQRGMLIGILVGLVLMAILLGAFYFRVHQPAVDAKPNPPPLKTQQ
jgi:hypothetical protein